MQWKTASHWSLGGHTDGTSLASWRTDSISVASPHPGWGCTAMKLSGMRWHPGGQGRSSPVCHLSADLFINVCPLIYLPVVFPPSASIFCSLSFFLLCTKFSLYQVSPYHPYLCVSVCLSAYPSSTFLSISFFACFLPTYPCLFTQYLSQSL